MNKPISEGYALGNLSLAYSDLGETRKAIDFHEQYPTIAREIDDRSGESNALWNKAIALVGLGQRKEAIDLAKAALRIYEQIEAPIAAEVRKWLAKWKSEK